MSRANRAPSPSFSARLFARDWKFEAARLLELAAYLPSKHLYRTMWIAKSDDDPPFQLLPRCSSVSGTARSQKRVDLEIANSRSGSLVPPLNTFMSAAQSVINYPIFLNIHNARSAVAIGWNRYRGYCLVDWNLTWQWFIGRICCRGAGETVVVLRSDPESNDR